MPSNVFSQERESLSVPAGRIAARWTTVLWLFAVLFPAIISFGLLHRQALSVPYQDDYNAILAFSIGYNNLPNAEAKVLDIAAAQHNEYKLGFEHAIVASELELTHHLDFKFLAALGNCFLLAIGYVLWRIYSGDGDLRPRLLRFLPVSLLFFSLTYWENLDWAMTDLQNIPVVFFSLLAVYLLVKVQPSGSTVLRMCAACITAAVAAFTSANAFLLAPVGLLFLVSRRAYARSLAWCASFVLPLAAYLYHYIPQSHELRAIFYLKRPAFFFAFLGDAVQNRWAALLLGLVIFAIILLAALVRFDQVNPAASYFTLWLVATAALVAWVRGGQEGFGTASRYSIYSILLLIFCYSFLAQHLFDWFPLLDRRRVYLASLATAIAFFLIADMAAYKHLEARRQMVLRGIELYREVPEANSPMIDPLAEARMPKEKKFEQVILTQAIQEHIYTLPPERRARLNP